MNAVTEFDIGPLTWVKSEIDQALVRADQALQQFSTGAAAGAADLTQIKFARTHLHQVHGALTIVGLDGVTEFATAVEGLLESIEQEQSTPDEACLSLIQRALAAIARYLDDLVAGQSNQPLRLLALYEEIQRARGQQRISPSDLFFPDLTVRPPRRESMAGKMAPNELQRFLRQERGRFQRGFLCWLRAPADRAGIADMQAAVKNIESTQEAPTARAFWWAAGGFLTALAEGGLSADANAKQLCARIDLQIRRLLEGAKNVAERLLRDVLYFVACADDRNPAVQQIKNAYHLQAIMPSAEMEAPAPEASVQRKLREIIVATEEAWGKFCAGTMQAVHVFKVHVDDLVPVVDQLGQTDFRRLAQAIAAAANWLVNDNSRHSDALAMEVATAILLAQNAQENYLRLGSDFAHQVDVTVARIHACIAGTPAQPEAEVPLLDEMSRQAQEKLLIGQVAKEIQSNFAQIEQVLDSFFRDTEKRADLVSLEAPINQVIGALTMMRHDSAVCALRECLAEIKRFTEPEYAAQESDFEQVASQLSLIGFFIDSLQYGATDYDNFVRQLQVPVPAPDSEEEGVPEVSVEQEVEQHKLEAHALLEALKEQQGDVGLREEVKNNLLALKSNAELVADATLGEQTKAMLSALETGVSELPQIDQMMATLKPETPEELQPSAETVQLSQSSTEEIDAELLDIFLEEAREVLASIAENVRLLDEHPHDIDVLTTVRRSFHTLKGSGRMVGLKDVGEVAWAIEQTLNFWLRQEMLVEPSLLDLLKQAHTVFSEWVHHLETHSGAAPDPAALVALAESLRSDGLPEAATAVTPPLEQGQVELVGEELVEDDLSDALAETIVMSDFPPFEEARPTAEIIPFNLPALSIADEDVGEEPGEEIAFTEVEGGAEEVVAEAGSGKKPEEEGPEPELISAAIVSEPEVLVEPVAQDPVSDVTEPPKAGLRITISPVLFGIFSEEAKAHLLTLQRELSLLEKDETAETPHNMYRAAHTLAGISATVGIEPVNRLGLALEHALLRRDNSEQKASLEALGVIRQAVGELELMLSALAGQQAFDMPPGLIDSLEALYPAAVSTMPSVVAVDALLEEACPVAAASPVPVIGEDDSVLPVSTSSFVAEIPRLQDEIDEQLLPIFLEEALDLNQGIAEQLRAWREAPEGQEVVRTLARLLHTLKGSARMAGAMNLGEVTHAIESRVELVSRDGSANVEVIDEIVNAFDAVLQITERLQHGESIDLPVAVVSTPASIAAVPGQTLADQVPASATVTAERRADRTRQGEAEPESDVASQRATLRVRADLIDRLVNDAGELSIARSRIEGEMRSLKESLLDLTENVIRLRRQLREIEIQAESQMQSKTAQAEEVHAGFDPLEFDRFTRFQELTRMMAESVNDVATVQQGLLKNLDDANAAIVAQARLNRELQQELLGVRMVPFASLKDRLYRVVRQTSKELGKRANLEVTGGQVELDRSVLDKISAPLEHMLRNSVAHGLEERELRIARGKSETGEISLALKQEGNEIILSLTDDGGGLDYERIRTHAIEVGLLGADEVADTARLAELIFASGFSTAESVSQIAGRGVGMDVVKTEITRLGGRIEVVSTPGVGTEFHLYIPLTLAVTKALIVRVGSHSYAVPSVMIEQVLDLKEAALNRIRDAGSAEWMGHHYAFSYLPHLLGDSEAVPEPHRQYWTLLLRSGTRRISVLVDELLGNEEIVVKNIGPQLARVIGVDGATVLGNGDVVLILNPVALSTRAPQVATVEAASDTPASVEEAPATASLPTVMVVDDSLTVRKITGRLLAREGYQVLVAKDGVDALEQLLEVVPDVMLVDIEMPRMDGFDLTRNIRADERLKNIPIIMITSRTADKHRSYAFELGVNNYLGKPYQEEELLELVAGYVRKPLDACA